MPCRSSHASFGLRLVASLAMTQACGGTASSSPEAAATSADDAGSQDAGSAPPEAAGYPATHPSVPIAQNAGGTILSAPRVVPVFFPGEARGAMLTEAIAKYLASSEWQAATAEYGIGAATLADPVQSTEDLPPNLSTVDLGTWLGDHLDGAHPGWGATDGDALATSIYLLYPPAGTALFAPEENPAEPSAVRLCGPHAWDPGGWHWQTTPAPGLARPLSFAVVGACTSGGVALADRMTATTTHELVEAATDPLFVTSPAYSSVDDAHAFWMELTGGGEVGDLCAQGSADLVTPVDVGYAIQRTWSNVAAAAGHDPCVPAPFPAYFNVDADAPDALFDPYANRTVQGIAIPAAGSRTIDVRLFSDRPTDPWKVTALDPNAVQGGRSLLKMTLDRSEGSNGDVLHLTLEPLFSGSGMTALYEIDSTLGGTTQRWYGEIVVH